MSRLWLQVLGIIACALVLFIGWDFGQRVMLTMRSQQVEQNLDQSIADAQATHTALVAQKQYAQTDTAVEDKARSYNWVRDGETLVHTLNTPAAPPPAASAPPPMPTPVPNALERVSGMIQDLFEFLFGP